MTTMSSKKPQPRVFIFAALILNILICGWYAVPMALDVIGSRANYDPIPFGAITIPAIFLHSLYLIWPMCAVIFSAFGLFKSGAFRILGLAFGLSFALFMSAVMVHSYQYSLEYDPHRMGGMIEATLVWVSLFVVNSFAVINLFKGRFRK